MSPPTVNTESLHTHRDGAGHESTTGAEAQNHPSGKCTALPPKNFSLPSSIP